MDQIVGWVFGALFVSMAIVTFLHTGETFDAWKEIFTRGTFDKSDSQIKRLRAFIVFVIVTIAAIVIVESTKQYFCE